MATHLQRWTMILEGMLNRVPTAAESTRAANAIAATINEPTLQWGTLTNGQKAEICVRFLRQGLVRLVVDNDQRSAAVAAAAAASAELQETP